MKIFAAFVSLAIKQAICSPHLSQQELEGGEISFVPLASFIVPRGTNLIKTYPRASLEFLGPEPNALSTRVCS